MRGYIVALLGLIGAPAMAAPGAGDPVYGAIVTKGMTEFEVRYGRLTGGTGSGEDGLVFEAERAVSTRLALAVLAETSREPDRSRRIDAVAVEAIRTLGHVAALGIDTALYVEVKHGLRDQPDAVEVKGLIEHRAGRFDARLNLIAERPWRATEPIAFGYAASGDWALIGDDLRIGLTAFGELGNSRRLGGRTEHFVGPTIKAGVERIAGGEIEIEAGWLRAFGAARDRTDGQARLLLSYERRF